MTTRRTFMKMSLAATGVAAAGSIHPKGFSQATSRKIDLLVIDKSTQEGRRFARAHRSLPQIGFAGDLLSTWQTRLRAAIAQNAMQFAGVTSGHSAFCLAQVARDYGYTIIHSDVFDPRRGFDPLRHQGGVLEDWDLNRPQLTQWIIGRGGIAFRTTAA